MVQRFNGLTEVHSFPTLNREPANREPE